jgi:DNA-binding winged helix-turn-helix (wHTH) protein/TolB-like protein/Tfp pilus assembly protein PilF
MREYRIHEFVLQIESRRLLGPDGGVVELTPRLFDALLFMVENAGQLLDKDRLLAALWPGLVVEENSLSQCISALRKALGDEAQRPRFIQTVPRRGFRFIAPVLLAQEDDSIEAGTEPVTRAAVPASTEPDTASSPELQTLAAPASPSLPEPRGRRVALVAAGCAGLLMLGGAGTWAWRSRRPPVAAGAPSTLAVLPFKPLAAGSRDELLEVGMAESLVARLSNLPGVAVRSVGSVRRYAGPGQDPISAARELQVTWIIDGSVQRAEGRVRVTARLLNTASGEAAWSGSFDETLTGVFDLQDAISAKVADVLTPHLERRDRSRLIGAGGTRLVDAYQLYLAARQHAQGIKRAGLEKSLALYQQAVALDPAYALAWSGMGEAYRRMVFGADGEPVVVLREAARCNERAVQLDPGLAEGHAGVGWVRFWRDWDWAAAATAFERALALNASEANAHLGYSQLLSTLARPADALRHLREARESDPMSLILLTIESSSLAAAGRREEAAERLQRVFDIEPEFWVAHMAQGGMRLSEGRAAEAIDSLERADHLSDGSSQAAASLGFALARLGQTERAGVLLRRLEAASESRYVPPTSIGLIHAGLRDKEAALAALQRGLAVRDVRMTLVASDGRWSLLRDDPRYADVLRQMKLSPQAIHR